MLETALNRIDALSNILETVNELRELSWIDVAEAELPILVVLAEGVHETLVTYEEAKVVAARNLLDFCLFAEGHLCWNALLDAILNEGPCKGLAFLRAGQIEIATCCDVVDLDIALCKNVDFLWPKDVLIVAKTKLAAFVAAPAHELARLLYQEHAPVLNSHGLLDAHAALVLYLNLFLVVQNMIQRNICVLSVTLIHNDLVHSRRLCALPIVVPAPDKDFAFAIDCHGMCLSCCDA